MNRRTLATSLYRRTSLPFRIVFTLLELLRAKNPLRLCETSSHYLAEHVKFTVAHRMEYGYHRVFELVRQFRPRDPGSLRMLVLGPRTEIELYYLCVFFGFAWENLSAIDVVSWSPKIQLADMSKALPYASSEFDVILASHCLEKSRDPECTRDELIRVIKPGGHILVGGDDPSDVAKVTQEAPYHVRFFPKGVYGVIELYGLRVTDITYLNAASPYGYELIFRVRKTQRSG